MIRDLLTAVPRYEELLTIYQFDRDFARLGYGTVETEPITLDLRSGADSTAARDSLHVKLVAALDCVALAWLDEDLIGDVMTVRLTRADDGPLRDLYALLDHDSERIAVLSDYGEGPLFKRFKRLRTGRYVTAPSGQYLRAGVGLAGWASAMPVHRFKVPAWTRSVPA